MSNTNYTLIISNFSGPIYTYPVFFHDRETSFTAHIDPRHFFPTLCEQLAYHAQVPGLLKQWTLTTKKQMDERGGYFKEKHVAKMCPSTQSKARACHLGCPFVHHLHVLEAMKQSDKPPAYEPSVPVKRAPPMAPPKDVMQPAELPGLQALAAQRPLSETKPPKYYFGLPPLRINEDVYQPIHQLNTLVAQEEQNGQYI